MSECPHPHKRRFETRATVDAERERLREREGAILYAYRCKCGSLHLTSRPRGDSSVTVARYLEWLHVDRFTDMLVR